MIVPNPTPPPAIDEALAISFIEGEIVFIGGRLGFSMTAGAARETSLRLAALLRHAGPGEHS